MRFRRALLHLLGPRLLPLVAAAALAVAAAPGVALSGPAPIAGSETRAFEAARTAWLSGDEAEALPALAELARRDNLAARMLLGLIDRIPELQGPWLTRLPREDRFAVLREGDGPSGRSWMRAAAEAEPRAQMWLDLWRPNADAALSLRFAEAGEPLAARLAALYAAARGRPELAEVVLAPAFPREMVHLSWPDTRGEPPREALRSLPEGHALRSMAGADVSAEARLAWLASEPLAAALTLLCAEACPETKVACLVAGYGALGGYEGLLHLGSPLEAVVSSSTFASSPRAREVLLRRILLAGRGVEGRLRLIGAESACLRDVLAAERARY